MDDVELLGLSYRALVDGDAYDDLIDAWDRRMALAPQGMSAGKQFSPSLLSQLGSLRELVLGQSEFRVADPVEELLNRFPNAAMVQALDGTVLAVNAKGERTFATRQGERDKGAWVAPAHRGLWRSWRTSIKAEMQQRRVIECIPQDCLQEADPRHKVTLADTSYVILEGMDCPVVLVCLLEFEWHEEATCLLRESWGLTLAESEVAGLYYRTRSLDLISSMRGVARETVRKQFKSILCKMDCSGQVELIRSLTAICIQSAIHRQERRLADDAPYHNNRTFVRSNGLPLGYSLAGPADGTPVLWLHGPVYNHALPAEIIAGLGELKVQLILVERPGYGRSPADLSIPVLDDQIDAVTELTKHLALQQAPAIATACSAAMVAVARDRTPSAFGPLAMIGNFWSVDSGDPGALNASHRALLAVAAKAPAMLDYLTGIAARIIRKKGHDWYLERAHGDNQFNCSILNDEETRRLLTFDTEAMMQQDGSGFSRDLLLGLTDPCPALARSRYRDFWLYGAAEAFSQRELPHDVQNLLPRLNVEAVPSSASLVAYHRPDRVINLIANLVGR